MVLFNIGSRLSFGNNHRHHHSRRRRRSYHSSTHYRKAGIYIDVGEKEPLHIEIDNANEYKIIHESENSVCVRITYKDTDSDEVLVVKWGNVLRDINSRDHIATRAADGIIEVPEYKNKEIITYYNKHINVSRRSYIKGQTLKSVYKSLNDDELDAIFMQVQAIIWQLAEKSSDYFGHIQDGNFKTNSPVGYLRTRVLMDKLKNLLNEGDWEEKGNDNYICRAIMCHGNLAPEHIILNGITVVGLIGWSSGDFVPEVYDRLQYYFRSNPKDPRCWFRKLSEIESGIESRRPSVEFVVNTTTYLYKSMWNEASVERRQVLTRLWKSITTNYTQVPCISTATEIESDNMSLSTLTSWWNSSASAATITY